MYNVNIQEGRCGQLPLSDEVFQRQVLTDLAVIKDKLDRYEKDFEFYRKKVDDIETKQVSNTRDLEDAWRHIKKMESSVDVVDQRVREDIAKEVSSIYRTAAIVGACISFVISVFLQRLG
jgi:hypothetical protein